MIDYSGAETQEVTPTKTFRMKEETKSNNWSTKRDKFLQKDKSAMDEKVECKVSKKSKFESKEQRAASSKNGKIHQFNNKNEEINDKVSNHKNKRKAHKNNRDNIVSTVEDTITNVRNFYFSVTTASLASATIICTLCVLYLRWSIIFLLYFGFCFSLFVVFCWSEMLCYRLRKFPWTSFVQNVYHY
jgi:hypothetical protein